jgi:hypothetical protein
VLLGPTNYHGYQPALRKLYEERFSRRMSFPEFQREIEVVNDPALIEQWKQQASSATVYHLAPPPPAKKTASPAKQPREQAEDQPIAETAPAPGEPAEIAAETPVSDTAPAEAPAPGAPEPPAEAEAPMAEQAPAAYDGPVFMSLSDVEQHFREHFLPGLIRTASAIHLTGEASRAVTDRAIAAAVRQAWEQERGFPGQMMHQLRQHFSRAGLHVFKHRKRMQFVSLIRPAPMEGGSLSESVAEILKVIQGSQTCNRASLAAAILGADESAVDPARKTTLATDLRWLIETGRVIEFSDGRLEMPVPPAKPDQPASKAKPEETPAAEAPKVEQPEPAAEIAGPSPGAESPAEPLLENEPSPEAVPALAAPEPALAAANAPVEESPTPEPAVISQEPPAAEL